ncbi:hypothetical protein CMQ_8034 [Grosmannia clavigera kw1407]|uniref:Uncharacterized protein n=1 Tax=Grosmannia clavigera (strain kw1407 / UAMH 11150) TaxID=655863 RepID=F0XKX5_GROCL|nr:uncharacterized protein CMQ_8034 [Grosmannia clavigera kw1407]EFX01568.1 hypothetical protein CMQ_8034 [Grosmannia clavigera kw1407]
MLRDMVTTSCIAENDRTSDPFGQLLEAPNGVAPAAIGTANVPILDPVAAHVARPDLLFKLGSTVPDNAVGLVQAPSQLSARHFWAQPGALAARILEFFNSKFVSATQLLERPSVSIGSSVSESCATHISSKL